MSKRMESGLERLSLPLGNRTVVVQSQLPCVMKLVGSHASRVIIGLHGFGDGARNFSNLADEFAAGPAGVRDTLWIFPSAPDPVPMTAEGGQWYDLFGPARADVERSARCVADLIRSVAEGTGLPTEKIFLFGFSQGAFVSLYTALRFERRLAGVVALSGYLAQVHRTPPLPSHVLETPIFVAHGLHDNVVLPAQHFETLDALEHWGLRKVVGKTYSMAHSIHPVEVADIGRFLAEHS